MPERDFELLIESLAFGGAGTGRLGGKVVFIPAALPGERVRASLLKDRGSYWQGGMLELLSVSPCRQSVACPLAVQASGRNSGRPQYCPGCAYQHCTQEAETQFKNQQFVELLSRIGGLKEASVLPAVQGTLSLGYRNKISLHAQPDGQLMRLGYYLEDNKTVLDIPRCPLACDGINDLLSSERAKPGFLRHTLRDKMELTFRHTVHNASFFWRGKPKPNETWLKEETPLGTLSVPRGSFFQVNPEGCTLLLEHVAALIEQIRPESVTDLYCGVGLFSLLAARKGVPEVLGIDCDAPAIAAARVNAERLQLPQCRFMAGDAGKFLRDSLAKFDSRRTLLLLDPPRSGLSPETRNSIGRSEVRELVYISCAPDTLARDLKELSSSGYELRSTRLVNMFPRTAHFETVTHLEKL